MRIISWNINGINAHFDALKELVHKYNPDILCLQKVKSLKGIEPFQIKGYKQFDIDTYRSRYYGVATYYRGLDFPLMNFPNDLAAEGHFQALNLSKYGTQLFNVYAPFSNPKGDFIEARKYWDAILQLHISNSHYFPIIMCGDFNVVHSWLDTWEDKNVKNAPCYFQWERDNFNFLLHSCDLIDVFRYLHPQARKYSYFDSKGDFRATNQGVRIDYFLISRSLLPSVKDCGFIEDITASNSTPIFLDIDLEGCGTDAAPAYNHGR